MNHKIVIQYKGDFYDISDFIHKHPGGVNTFKGIENSDMTDRFKKAPPHSDAALYLMNEYKRSHLDSKEELKQLKIKKKNSNGRKVKNIENELETISTGAYFADCDSMEHLVDWSKPMLSQIGNLGSNYTEWVNKPVDRPLRLFESWYLEICTKTPWWLVPLFWVPIIIYLIRSEVLPGRGAKALYLILGSFVWTLVEYLLHRLVFHMKTDHANRWICTFHFAMHGLHHKVPFDPYRLVFPPLPAAIITMIMYVPVYTISTYPNVLLAGGLIGYLAYDMMHYYLHYGNPRTKHLYHMKRYHYQHHFVHHDLGFGISSPLWDLIFGTSIRLRKLKYLLEW